jgi:serine/threonine-protein kinase
VIVSRDDVNAAAAAASAGVAPGSDAGELRRRRRWRGWVGALIVVLLALAAVGLGFWLTVGRYTSVPGVVGMKADAAIAKLQDAGLKGTVGDSAFSATIPKGEVVTSNPAPGSRVKEGASVTLTVSKGPESIPVPSVVGQPLGQAEQQIRGAGLAVGKVTKAYSETVAKGSVISADPAPGKALRPNTPVDLTVSKGPAPIPVPNVVGKTEADARSILTSAGFRVSTSQDYSDSVPDGSVISQNPSSGAKPANTVIALVISKGPKLYPVPKVEGMKLEAAIKALEAAGFVPDVYNTPGGPNVVIVQSPGPGTMAPHGETVTLTVV